MGLMTQCQATSLAMVRIWVGFNIDGFEISNYWEACWEINDRYVTAV